MFNLVYHQGLFWVHYCLTYVIIFFSKLMLALLVMLTITRHTVLVKFQRRKSRTTFKWFENNGMNFDKCHMLVNKNGSFVTYIGERKISNIKISDIKTEKLLGSPCIIDKLSIITFLSYAKQSVINFMHLLELHLTWIKIRKKHFLIYIFFIPV